MLNFIIWGKSKACPVKRPIKEHCTGLSYKLATVCRLNIKQSHKTVNLFSRVTLLQTFSCSVNSDRGIDKFSLVQTVTKTTTNVGHHFSDGRKRWDPVSKIASCVPRLCKFSNDATNIESDTSVLSHKDPKVHSHMTQCFILLSMDLSSLFLQLI